MPTSLLNGVRLYWERTGETGDPLVLVHGSWVDHHTWDHIVPALARTFRVATAPSRCTSLAHGRRKESRHFPIQGRDARKGPSEGAGENDHRRWPWPASRAASGVRRYDRLVHTRVRRRRPEPGVATREAVIRSGYGRHVARIPPVHLARCTARHGVGSHAEPPTMECAMPTEKKFARPASGVGRELDVPALVRSRRLGRRL
jgi:hypothetical protein